MFEKLLMCTAAVFALILPMYVGHGIAVQNYGRMLVGVAFAIMAAVLFFILLRMYPATREDRH